MATTLNNTHVLDETRSDLKVAEYLAALRKNVAHCEATEHTHRPALKSLLESLGKSITASNEPKRIDVGTPLEN